MRAAVASAVRSAVLPFLAAGCLPYHGDARAARSATAAPVPTLTAEPGAIETVLLPSKDPLVSFRFLFRVGSANDPPGKEGLAALAAAMGSEAGSRERTYEEIVQAMYPMATSFSSQVDHEMTVFFGTTHRDNLERYYEIVSGMLLDPGFREEDFRRVQDDALNFLKVSLRENNEEELGKEVLYLDIYRGHPFGRHPAGTLAGLEGITLEDVREFHRRHYTRANLVLGMSGGYEEAFLARVRRDLDALPQGTPSRVALSEPKPPRGRELTMVRKETRAVAISLGFPIEVTRSHADWIALDLARSWLGQHRNSSARLFQRIREVRGLNYGDYAYIEYFPRGMFQFVPDPNLARRQQIFQVWIRPVEPENAHFALRIALHELSRLVEKGLTREAFEETRDFLRKNAALVAKTQSARLGYALDAQVYGYDDFVAFVRRGLDRLTLEEVNAAIRRHLQAENLRIVMVAKEADALRDAIVAETPSPIAYNAPKPAEVLAEDEVIARYPLRIPASKVRVVPVEEIFSR